MSASSTNYREDLFRHQDLTRIHGEPSFATLRILARELRANAGAVHSTLGGGTLGHIGLLLTNAQYDLLAPGTPYLRPAFPVPLDIPVGSTRIAEAQLTREHKEESRIFYEVLGVENALKQQLIKAIDSNYLEAIRDPVTYDLQGTICDTLTYLVTTYGKVTPDEVYTFYEKVCKQTYSPATPIDLIFQSIVDLAELGDAALLPYSPQQQIAIGENILNRSGRFVQDIREWKRLTPAAKTWPTFKQHFRRAHAELKETNNDTLGNLQRAHIAQTVIEGIQDLLPTRNDTPEPVPPIVPTQPPTMPHALAATDPCSAMIPSLMQQMTAMQQMMASLQTAGRGRGGRGVQGRGRGRGVQIRNPAHHILYCWTHGMCRHDGNACLYPATGHQATATKENRMRGSDRNCD